MKELTPTWKIACTVIWKHYRISNNVTTILLIIAAIITYLANWLFDLHITLDTLRQNYLYILPVFLFIHFVPVNIYAVKRILDFEFKRFRLQLTEFKKESQP